MRPRHGWRRVAILSPQPLPPLMLAEGTPRPGLVALIRPGFAPYRCLHLPGAAGVRADVADRSSRSPMTCRCRKGSRSTASMTAESASSRAAPSAASLAPASCAAASSRTAAWSGTTTSWRRRRQRETFMLSAVRTTHAFGDGCLLTLCHAVQARANASATRSCAVSRSPTLTRTARRQSSLASR
jgi:hypothetical protein